MGIILENTIPLGRRKEEYIAMFNIQQEELTYSILDCGGGPSSFNREMTKDKGNVVSIDIIYQFKDTEIQNRIDETFEDMMKQAQDNKDKFVWNHIASTTELRNLRKTAMTMFIEDYQSGLKEGRYIYAQLPTLPFRDNEFDLALCSHLMFLYSDILSYEFHFESISEMLRVASEIRIFPIVDLNCNQSAYVEDIMASFKAKGYEVTIEACGYEFQKGANKLMRIKKH
ncbi:MAG: SAM-dependent methyltransferase [Vallitaleaceae bacterium]|jgi:hypothetical protein|nr:SAM-dependent methyltransferase [Vallitaleaceae bacterium]